MERSWAEVIEANPIAEGLDDFRVSFRRSFTATSISDTTVSLKQLSPNELQNLASHTVINAAGSSRSSKPTDNHEKSTFVEISRLNAAIATDNFELDRVHSLLRSAIDKADDFTLWNQLRSAVAETSPRPRPIASSIQQTPWLRNTSSFPNSSEYHKHVDGVLKEELGLMYVGSPKFWDTYFGGIDDLEAASEIIFKQCTSGPSPKFDDGWKTWPTDAGEDNVLDWFAAFYKELATFAADRQPRLSRQRRPLAKLNEPIDGSVGKRKSDIGFVNDPEAQKDTRCHWSQILVPGGLKSNHSADQAAEAWLDLGRSAREVLAAQDTGCLVLALRSVDLS